MKRRYLVVGSAVVVLALLVAVYIVARQRPLRRRTLQPSRERVQQTSSAIPLAQLPVEKWSGRVIALERSGNWKTLLEELGDVEKRKRALYESNFLGYLHARAAKEAGESDEAIRRYQPYLASGNPLRLRALEHRIDLAEEKGDRETAARFREMLIAATKESEERSERIEAQLDHLIESSDEVALKRFIDRIYGSASSTQRRELDARMLERDVKAKRLADAMTRGKRLLDAGQRDDAADRAFRALDHPQIISIMAPELLVLLGETAKEHRHFDGAVPLLAAARSKLPAQRDELTFSIGRSQFGLEEYADAEKTYSAGAAATADPKWKSTFLFHASRAAQLRGDDATAERLMTSSLAVKGKFPSTSAAVTQRMRTRARQKRWGEARSDLEQIRKLFPNERPILDASLSYAVALIAAQQYATADGVLDSIPLKLRDPYDKPEITYWRARSYESRDARKAAGFYLQVLRADVPTHFAYFARERLSGVALKAEVTRMVSTEAKQVDAEVAKKEWNRARELQTDVVLLAPGKESLAKLRTIYEQIPQFRSILELRPEAFPIIESAAKNRSIDESLLAMGLFDEAVSEIKRRFPLGEPSSTLSQALGLNLAGASRESILAVEILMKRIPRDFVPELLPQTMLELLYPRYFYDAIVTDSESHDADPRLVLSIMREESRFNPRAKSAAAARGLLQFIITTARDVGHDLGIVELEPHDLYDPRTIIRLGAKYIGDLLETFNGNRYQAAAAYNAGPHQTKLWARLAPAAGDDYFLSSINFDETKHYVRKVLNSYWRYAEIYDEARPPAGMRVEP